MAPPFSLSGLSPKSPLPQPREGHCHACQAARDDQERSDFPPTGRFSQRVLGNEPLLGSQRRQTGLGGQSHHAASDPARSGREPETRPAPITWQITTFRRRNRFVEHIACGPQRFGKLPTIGETFEMLLNLPVLGRPRRKGTPRKNHECSIAIHCAPLAQEKFATLCATIGVTSASVTLTAGRKAKPSDEVSEKISERITPNREPANPTNGRCATLRPVSEKLA